MPRGSLCLLARGTQEPGHGAARRPRGAFSLRIGCSAGGFPLFYCHARGGAGRWQPLAGGGDDLVRESCHFRRSAFSVGPLGVSGGYGVGPAPPLRVFDRGPAHLPRVAPPRGHDPCHPGPRGRRPPRDSSWLCRAMPEPPARWNVVCAGMRRLGIAAADVLLPGRQLPRRSERLLERAARIHREGDGAPPRDLRAPPPRLRARRGRSPRFAILHIRYNAAHTGAEANVFPHLGPAVPGRGPSPTRRPGGDRC